MWLKYYCFHLEIIHFVHVPFGHLTRCNEPSLYSCDLLICSFFCFIHFVSISSLHFLALDIFKSNCFCFLSKPALNQNNFLIHELAGFCAPVDNSPSILHFLCEVCSFYAVSLLSTGDKVGDQKQFVGTRRWTRTGISAPINLLHQVLRQPPPRKSSSQQVYL